MAIRYESINTDSVGKQIAESIREAIVSGDLKVNERLPTEEELAERFQVSRPTIREALKRLAAQNLIRSRRGPTGGTFVNKPSQAEVASALASASTLLASMGEFELSDIAEARLGLEIFAARLAAERRDLNDLALMEAELDLQQDPSISDVAFCDSDVRFHHLVVDCTRNPVLRLVMSGVVEALQPAANLVAFRFRERREITRQHRRLLDAIRAGDADAAEQAVIDQVAYLSEIYARVQEWRRQRDTA